MRPRLPLLVLLLLPAPLLLCGERAADADPVSVAWRLRPSDFVRYERRTVTVDAGTEKLSGPSILTILGHDLRDEGRFLPVSPTRQDLPAILAFQVPAPGESTTKVNRTLKLRDIVLLKLKGTIEAEGLDADRAEIRSTWTFSSRGRGERKDSHGIVDGEARVRAVFDYGRRIVESARLTLTYDLRKLDPDPGEKSQEIEQTFDIRLHTIRRARYDDFQRDVDTAIEKGVAFLRTLQQDDGDFKPHGNHQQGSTALAVLTLVACDVSRSDPAVEKALERIFRQKPTRNYDRAVCLMAIDRAYTPPEEWIRARRTPITEYVRDLPPDRRAWCMEVAEALETSASSPGSWGYPSAPRTVLQFDTSNTQYAVLGLRAASHLGYEVGEQTWLGVVRHFNLVRERKGPRGEVALVRRGEAVDAEGRGEAAPYSVPNVAGFRYATLDSYPRPWGSMTCAGIASLSVARHELLRMGSSRVGRLETDIEKLILGAWAWLDAHWGVDRHPEHPSNSWYYYYLYSLERAGILTDVKRVDRKDWYFEGAMQLLTRQAGTGAWPRTGQGGLSQTCFALLFLKRATAPLTTPGD